MPRAAMGPSSMGPTCRPHYLRQSVAALRARTARAPPVSPKAVNASEEFLGQRDDDARRASHVAESVHVLVLGHFADEFGAVGAQASDSVVDAFDCEHDAPEAQRVRRCDRRFDIDQLWI